MSGFPMKLKIVLNFLLKKGKKSKLDVDKDIHNAARYKLPKNNKLLINRGRFLKIN